MWKDGHKCKVMHCYAIHYFMTSHEETQQYHRGWIHLAIWAISRQSFGESIPQKGSCDRGRTRDSYSWFWFSKLIPHISGLLNLALSTAVQKISSPPLCCAFHPSLEVARKTWNSGNAAVPTWATKGQPSRESCWPTPRGRNYADPHRSGWPKRPADEPPLGKELW